MINFCPNCKSIINDGDIFCAKCGVNILDFKEAKEHGQNASKNHSEILGKSERDGSLKEGTAIGKSKSTETARTKKKVAKSPIKTVALIFSICAFTGFCVFAGIYSYKENEILDAIYHSEGYFDEIRDLVPTLQEEIDDLGFVAGEKLPY